MDVFESKYFGFLIRLYFEIHFFVINYGKLLCCVGNVLVFTISFNPLLMCMHLMKE